MVVRLCWQLVLCGLTDLVCPETYGCSLDLLSLLLEHSYNPYRPFQACLGADATLNRDSRDNL